MNIQSQQNPMFSGNSYDPSLQRGNGFDPNLSNRWNGADGSAGAPGQLVVSAKPGQKMQVNITCNNPSASVLTFELFNYLTSFSRIRNTSYAVAAYLYIPLLTYEGLAAFIATTDQTVGFNQTGDLEIHAAPAAVKGTIGCAEVPYNSLFEASGVTPFQIAAIRYTVKTDAQISNSLIIFQKSYSGGETTNNINPRSFFQPNQFQNFIIDINIAFAIGIDTGIRVKLQPAETVTFSLFIQMWSNQTLSQG